ncbi:MAG: hypothetical protein Q7V63_02570 [Gammaproteobacteria bacterium]|nr:hypothetical protein [Gammaproteobacteria bacterium]
MGYKFLTSELRLIAQVYVSIEGFIAAKAIGDYVAWQEYQTIMGTFRNNKAVFQRYFDSDGDQRRCFNEFITVMLSSTKNNDQKMEIKAFKECMASREMTAFKSMSPSASSTPTDESSSESRYTSSTVETVTPSGCCACLCFWRTPASPRDYQAWHKDLSSNL